MSFYVGYLHSVGMFTEKMHWFQHYATYFRCSLPVAKTVFTSDHALKLEFVPDWIAIVGSGYIGLEFSDVYTAIGSEVFAIIYS